MFEAYKVAVKLSLVNNVTAGLVSLTSQFATMNKHVATTNKELALMEARLAAIKRLGMVGGALAVAGFGMLGSLKGPLGQAMDWEREAAKLRQMGLGDAQIKDAQKFVQANDIIGTSMQQRMKLFAEAQGAFRESGMDGAHALAAAKTMMPVLAQYETATKLLGGTHTAAHEGAMRNLNKTVEIMGGLGDAKRAAQIADGVFQAVQSSGKMVDERQLKQFVAYGGSATNQLGMRAIFGGLEPLIGEFGGSTAAVGLRTAYTRMNGMMSLPPKLMLAEMQRLGMADATGKKQSDELARLQATDVPAYAKKIMEMYAAKGITSQTDRERENAILFGTNGSKIYNKLMQQMPVIEESLKAYDKAHGISQVVRDEKDSPMMAIEKFHKAMDDLGLVIGQTVLPVLTPMIESLSSLFKWLGKYPALVKTLTVGFVGLATAMAIGGTLTLLTAGFKAIGMALSVGKAGALPSALSATAIGLRAVGVAAGAFLAIYAGYKIGEAAAGAIDRSIEKNSGGVHGSLRSWLQDTWFGKKTGWFDFGKDEALHFKRADVSGNGSRFVAGKVGGEAQKSGDVYLDREKVGKVLWSDMNRELRRPMAGTSRPDGRMAMTPVGASGR